LSAVLLVAASCGDSGETQIAAGDPVPDVVVVDQPVPVDEGALVEGAVSESRGPDVELSVSADGMLDDAVVVTIKIRSVDTKELKSPEVLLELGDGVALAEGNGACLLNDGELRCMVSDKTEDDSLATPSTALDIHFEVAPDVVDPSVKFTAVSANKPVTLDADPSNNVVTVVFVRLPASAEPRIEDELPRFTLEVHSDGCGVFRSGEIGDDLTWVVMDKDGFQVLGRNAAGETQYRYFLPGTYTVVLETWGGGHYVAVSNEVTISC